jgi:hypothetical protein
MEFLKNGAGVLILVVLTLTAPATAQRGPLTLGVPARGNDHVSAAADGAFVALVWAASAAGATDIYSAVSRDGGASFGAPVRVNAVAGQAAANTEQPPRVVLLPQRNAPPELIVVWTARTSGGTRLLSARSHDGGATFGKSSIVPGSEAAGNRGWHAIAVDRRGQVHAVWLDHRDAAAGESAGAHEHQHGTAASRAGGDGVTRAQRSQLYVGTLDGPAAHGIVRGVCYCCKTALVAGGDGALFLAWRHVYPGNRRDIAFAASRDGGRTFSAPVRVSEDQWVLDGCPENGPALALDDAQRIHVVWPTLVTDRGRETLRLFHASTRDGRTFSARSALPAVGAAYHPQLVRSPDGTLYVAWDEFVNGGRRLRVARGRPDAAGAVRFEPVQVNGGAAAVAPAIAAGATHLIVAWANRASRGEQMLSVSRVPYRP